MSLLIYSSKFLLNTYCNIPNEKITINEDKSVQVFDDVYIKPELVKNGKLIINFDKIYGNFCIQELHLTSLDGCPKFITGNFTCDLNDLPNLINGPITVAGYYACSNNKLTSLEGCPNIIHGDFFVNYNFLKNLKHTPAKINGKGVFSYNMLTSLEGCPKYVEKQIVLYGQIGNGIIFSEKEVRDVCKVGMSVYV